MHMGVTSDPLFKWFNRLIKANVLRTTLLVTGSHVMRFLTNEMSVRAFWVIKPESLRLSKLRHLADFFSWVTKEGTWDDTRGIRTRESG